MTASRDLLDFTDRTVVITGAATGMGAATADLLLSAGATVHAVDNAPVAAAVSEVHQCDLGAPDAVVDLAAALPERVDVLMNCAGVPNGGRFTPLEIMAINWTGLRQLTELMVPRIPDGGSVVHIASTAGRAWEGHHTELDELMAVADPAEANAWLAERPDLVADGYVFSKEAVQYYTHWRSVQTLADHGIRMNSVCPGITDTALLADFRKGMGDEIIDRAERVAGRAARADEMAPTMLFLADEASSSYVNGVNLNVDRGTAAARLSNQTPE